MSSPFSADLAGRFEAPAWLIAAATVLVAASGAVYFVVRARRARLRDAPPTSAPRPSSIPPARGRAR